MPEKAEAHQLYSLIKATGLHLVAGGLRDQPHIWLLEFLTVEEELKLLDQLPKYQPSGAPSGF